MRWVELDGAQLSAAHELARRLHHDVGKYATLHARWLPPAASPEARLQAARDDLLRTARGPRGHRDVVEVAAPWVAALRGEVPLQAGGFRVDLSGDTSVAELLEAMDALAALLEPLRGPDEAAIPLADEALSAAARVRDATQALVAATRPRASPDAEERSPV